MPMLIATTEGIGGRGNEATLGPLLGIAARPHGVDIMPNSTPSATEEHWRITATT